MKKTKAIEDPLVQLRIGHHQLILTLSPTEAWPRVMAEVSQQLQSHSEQLAAAEVIIELGERPVPKYEMASLAALLSRRGLRLQTVHSSSETTQKSAAALSLYQGVDETVNGVSHNKRQQFPGSQLPLIPEQVGLPALYIPQSVESGQRIFSRGPLFVAGDVMRGAQLAAVSDIVVWGRLAGRAHVGVNDDRRAVIRALAFLSEEVYIGDIRIDPLLFSEVSEPSELRISGGQVELRSWPLGIATEK